MNIAVEPESKNKANDGKVQLKYRTWEKVATTLFLFVMCIPLIPRETRETPWWAFLTPLLLLIIGAYIWTVRIYLDGDVLLAKSLFFKRQLSLRGRIRIDKVSRLQAAWGHGSSTIVFTDQSGEQIKINKGMTGYEEFKNAVCRLQSEGLLTLEGKVEFL